MRSPEDGNSGPSYDRAKRLSELMDRLVATSDTAIGASAPSAPRLVDVVTTVVSHNETRGLPPIRSTRFKTTIASNQLRRGELVSAVCSRCDSGVRIVEITVRVEMNRRGAWELTVPDDHTRIVCATLADATRRARSIAGTRPSELIVHDAYHRLVEHERLGISCRYHA